MLPQRGDSNESPQYMFLNQSKKNNVYAGKYYFSLFKVGFSRVFSTRICQRMSEIVNVNMRVYGIVMGIHIEVSYFSRMKEEKSEYSVRYFAHQCAEPKYLYLQICA